MNLMSKVLQSPALRIVAGLALMGVLLFWIGVESLLASLTAFHPGFYLSALALLGGHFFLQSLMLKHLLDSRQIEVRSRVVFRLILIAQFFGLFFPGGTGPDMVLCYNLVRSTEKKEVAFTAVIFIRIAVLALMSTIAFVASFHPMIGNVPLQLMTGSVVLAFGAYFLLMSHHGSLRVTERFFKWLAHFRIMRLLDKVYQALAAFSRDFAVIRRITPHLLASAMIKIVTDYFISRSLGFDIPLHYFFIVVPLATVIAAVPITFAGLGIREGAFIGLFAMLGVSPEQALAISLLSFTLAIVTAGIGSVLYGIYGSTIVTKNISGAALLSLIAILTATGCGLQSNHAAEIASDVEVLTGGHTRVVWVQDRVNLNDVFASGSALQLVGYDSRDGKGERLIHPDQGSYNKPMFSPDGTQVIFSDLTSGGAYAIDWTSQQKRRLATGFALTVWRDPQTAIDWVYVGTQRLPDGAPAYQRVDRVQLFHPEQAEFVMDQFPVGADSFQLSADGRIAGGNFPWPECGIVHMQEQRFERLGRGCWTALAPDDSYRFWIFDGSHRNLLLFDTRNNQRVTISVANAPGIEGHEAYHPRWSNHPQVMAITGPYKIRQGGNNIRGGGADVEILIGRFSSDFQRLENWVQLTSNDWANFFPDVWVNTEAAPSPPPQDLRAAAIETLTGSRSRLVWLQDVGDNTDYLARGTQLQLMGLDTRDGAGERIIVPSGRNMAKPMFTIDGQRILFSDRDAGTMHMVDWDGGTVQDLGEGFVLHTWHDPQSGIEFLYYAKNFVDDGKTLPTHEFIYRRALPPVALNWESLKLWARGRTRDRRVWHQTHVSEDSYQLSADGRFASAPFPWPEVGVHDIGARRWRRHGRGCWVAMSPDNSYLFWILDGPHRNLIMEQVGRPEGERWPVNISNLPETDRYEVYHPRWSNHPRILAITGPYKVGEGAYRLPGGGAGVEIWLGRFTEDHKSIEHWVQATNNDRADFYPDVWVEPDPAAQMGNPAAVVWQTREPTDAWPSSRQGLRYLWEHAAAQNEIELANGQRRIFRPEASGLARFGEHQTLWVEGGYFSEAKPPALQAPFSIEAVLHDREASRLIVSIDQQWRLGQSDGEWWLDTPESRIALGKTGMESLQHMVLVATGDSLTLLVNGTALPRVDLEQPLGALTGEIIYWGGDPDQPGRGRMSHLALYDRALSAAEAEAHYRWITTYFEQQPTAPVLEARGRLIGLSSIPTPADIAPYRRALVFNEYEILDGELHGERLLAAHWTILDGRILPSAERIVGEEYPLRLVLFDQRPELEGERVAMDNEDFLLEWYYDLNL